MTPELLAHLTDAEREAWELCQKAIPGPWEVAEEPVDRVIRVGHSADCRCGEADDLGHYCGYGHVVMRVHDKRKHFNNRRHDPANIAFIAHARTGYPEALLELAKARQALAELRAAVAEAPHDTQCRSEAELCDETCGKSGCPHMDRSCDCWKSRLK